MKWKRNSCFWVVLFFATLSSFAQKGSYYITNFSPSDYGASDQNWGCVQDEWGRIFIANNDGVFLYDGKNWKPTFLQNHSACVSLKKDNNNKIFIGGQGEFGYIDCGLKGDIVYKSLSQLLPPTDSTFGNIWATVCINNDVFFGSNEKLFWYKNGKLKSFSPEKEAFHTFFKVGNHLFVREKQIGFKVFIDGELIKIEGSENFATQRVDFIIPIANNNYWVGTRNDGIYKLLYNKALPQQSVFTKTKTYVDEWLKENELYCGSKINENTYALGSLKGGILLTDSNLNPIDNINYKKGLLDDGVKNIFVDNNENIWLSLNFGISFIELNTPITRWTMNNGVKGTVESCIKYENKLFIATDKGLQILNEENNKFIDTDIGDQVFSLLVKNNDLLVATASGLYKFSDNKTSLLYESSIYSLFSDTTSNLVYMGTDLGMVIGNFTNGLFTELKYFNDWGDVRSIAKDNNNNIAVGTSHKGVYVLRPGKDFNFNHIAKKEGLPIVNENFVLSYRGEFLIAGDTGFYKIQNETLSKCTKVENFNSSSNSISKATISRAKQINDDLWFQYSIRDENLIKKDLLSGITIKNNEFIECRKMLHRIKDVNTKAFFNDCDKVYISTNAGLYCFDKTSTPKQNEFYTFISNLNFKDDTSFSFANLTPEIKIGAIEVPFKSNELHISPAASDYHDINELKYSYYLEGKENNFGKWTKTSAITYNNLHEGHYIFHLKSQNILGNEGKEITFSFTVLPPWYRTMLAYTCYVIIIVLFIWVIVKWNSRRLVAQNIKLEETISERTKTIVDQKAEIEIKKQEITDSINYAKRIQNAILPSVKEIKKTWKDIFIFFQPKDIVSGDFYWYHKINEHEFLIAIADCTGHGVPGGFMSMICSDKLNDAINHTTDPSEILFRTNNAVKFALKSGDEEESKDGMEILLLKVNTQTRKVVFSGANLTLLINKKGNSEMESIRSTKASVGSITPHDFKYQLFELQLSEGDQLYISSDGYADQFGGPEGKKYLSKNLRNFLFSIKDYPISKQHELLSENIASWMKGYDQIDDLLIIGIKL